MALQRVAKLHELWPGEMLACQAGQRRLVLVRLADSVHAYEDRCSHLGFPLSRGELKGNVLTCPAHLWQYDARTGCGINPASARLKTVPVTLQGGDVLVEVSSAECGVPSERHD